MRTIDAIAVVAGLQASDAITLPVCMLDSGVDCAAEFAVASVAASGRLEACRTQQDLLDAIVPAGNDFEAGHVTREQILQTLERVLADLQQWGDAAALN